VVRREGGGGTRGGAKLIETAGGPKGGVSRLGGHGGMPGLRLRQAPRRMRTAAAAAAAAAVAVVGQSAMVRSRSGAQGPRSAGLGVDAETAARAAETARAAGTNAPMLRMARFGTEGVRLDGCAEMRKTRTRRMRGKAKELGRGVHRSAVARLRSWAR